MPASAAPTNSGDSALSPSRPSLALRVWRLVASPWCTLVLLAILAVAGVLSLFLPQARASEIPIHSYWLAMLQGRYGRWTGLLGALGLFDIEGALWFHVLLVIVGYQSAIAMIDAGETAWSWLRTQATSCPPLSPNHVRHQAEMSLYSGPLEEGVATMQLALHKAGYRSMVIRADRRVLLEAMRYPWLALSRPVAHVGIFLACVAVLLGARLDWQEGPAILSARQQYELSHVKGRILRLDEVGVALSSSRLYSWVTLLRDGQPVCAGLVATEQTLDCRGIRIQQSRTEPALRIAGYDASGHAVAIESLSGKELADAGVTLSMPAYLPDRYAVLRQQGLVFHVEASPSPSGAPFRVEVYRGQQNSPLLEEEISEPSLLSLDGLVFSFVPTRVPSFRVSRSPTKPLRWAGLSLALAGLLVGLALPSAHAVAELEERGDEVHIRVWWDSILSLPASTIQGIKSRAGYVSEAET